MAKTGFLLLFPLATLRLLLGQYSVHDSGSASYGETTPVDVEGLKAEYNRSIGYWNAWVEIGDFHDNASDTVIKRTTRCVTEMVVVTVITPSVIITEFIHIFPLLPTVPLLAWETEATVYQMPRRTGKPGGIAAASQVVATVYEHAPKNESSNRPIVATQRRAQQPEEKPDREP